MFKMQNMKILMKGDMINNEHCLFCDIVFGKIDIEIVSETKNIIAFRDINPQAPTHILIIPKKHIKSTKELNEHNIHYLSEMALVANKVSEIKNISKDGYRWVVNSGKNGGQSVNHLHLHLLGGRQLLWPPG